MKLILLTCALLLAGCPGGGGAGHGSSAGTAIIQLRCDVPDANIWIDDRAVGQVQEASGGTAVLLDTPAEDLVASLRDVEEDIRANQ